MTVGELIKKLSEYPADAKVVTARNTGRKGKSVETLDDVFSGENFKHYDEDFLGTVVIW